MSAKGVNQYVRQGIVCVARMPPFWTGVKHFQVSLSSPVHLVCYLIVFSFNVPLFIFLINCYHSSTCAKLMDISIR